MQKLVYLLMCCNKIIVEPSSLPNVCVRLICTPMSADGRIFNKIIKEYKKKLKELGEASV